MPWNSAIWEKFFGYEDTDGYYFLQEWWDCSESNELNWTYFPPARLKASFEKIAATYPYPNDTNTERELIQIADDKAA